MEEFRNGFAGVCNVKFEEIIELRWLALIKLGGLFSHPKEN
jgi:hypothetical protein